jgi:hypothetical protein
VTDPRLTNLWFALGMVLLGTGLALNTLLGPLMFRVITYPFTETVRNETLGLEAVTLVLIAPLAIAAGLLALRGHRAAGILALGPAAYAAYMLVQYVVGPQYPTYQPSIALHLALFVLSVGMLLWAWITVDSELRSRSRGWAIVAFALAAFVVSRWLPAFAGMLTNDPIPAAPPDVTMYWSIFLLDLGLVVPATVATGIGLLVGSRWANKALYGVVGWFALVPPSVAAMSIVKLLRSDPNATSGDTIVFVVVTLVFWVIAFVLFRPFFARSSGRSGERPLRGALATDTGR